MVRTTQRAAAERLEHAMDIARGIAAIDVDGLEVQVRSALRTPVGAEL